MKTGKWLIPALLFGCLVATAVKEAAAQDEPIAADAEAIKPLAKGESVPDVTLQGADGDDVALTTLYEEQPLVIVFFRGSWCPICSRHTQALMKVYPELKEKGYEMIGVSPDTVENTKANMEQGSISFPLYSDSALDAAKGFGLAFKVDDATVTKYKGYGIDLAKASGRDHQSLPVPAIFVVNQDGVIDFAHSDPDYRKRFEPGKLVEELAR